MIRVILFDVILGGGVGRGRYYRGLSVLFFGYYVVYFRRFGDRY